MARIESWFPVAVIAVAAALVLIGCGSGKSLPTFARPAAADGFDELAHGQTPEKVTHSFWVFGGNQQFSGWRSEAVAVFTKNGWRATPDENDPDSAFSLYASSPTSDLCVSYQDLSKVNYVTMGYIRMVEQEAPGTLAGAERYVSILFATAGPCP